MQPVKADEISQTKFLLEDLMPYSIYTVSVEASTSAGQGERTERSLVTLPGGEFKFGIVTSTAFLTAFLIG